MPTDLITQVFDQSDAKTLLTFGRGIEREALRTDSNGQLAQTPHPESLGEKLTHPLFTTDFSEAQLELITPVHASNESVLAHLENIHQWTAQRLGEERLWPGSMPCVLPGEGEIPLAYYGQSNSGRLKTTYRHGLGLRYNRTMQTICAVHYNFSFATPLLERLEHFEGRTNLTEPEIIAARSSRYFALMRNFRTLAWLPAYLFGASPAVDESFLRDDQHDLTLLGERTFYKPFATSLRSGGLGYQSSTQSNALNICYNNLANYTQTLRDGITTEHEPYRQLGQQSLARFPQVNANLLQSEAEFYSSIRAKATPPIGANFLAHLDRSGVQYIEVRLLDINPYLPLGVDLAQLDFMDLLILHCLLTPSPEHDPTLCRTVTDNFHLATEFGRKPGLALTKDHQSIALTSWAGSLFEALEDLAQALDEVHGGSRYRACLSSLAPRVTDPSKTPSGRILSDLSSAGSSLLDHHRQLSADHFDHCYNLSLSAEIQTTLDEITATSRQSFKEIPTNTDAEFEAFLAQYHQAYLPTG